MKITLYGHCCLLVEEGGLRMLTDPGNWSSGFEALEHIDVVLITHEHSDHLHIPALQAILAANPNAKIITNQAVGRLLAEVGLVFEILEDSQSREDKSVTIEAIGREHAVIYPTTPNVQNTGFFIGKKLFYPGDAFTLPERPVDILALPVAAPWLKISESIDYALAVKPKLWVPVHDAVLARRELGFKWPAAILQPLGMEGRMLELGKENDF